MSISNGYMIGKTLDDSNIIRYQESFKNDVFISEQYDIHGKNSFPNWVGKEYVYSIATPAQIEQYLKAYAEKNGYVDQCVVKSVITESLSKLDYTDGTEYNHADDEFWFCGAWIYSKGKWAEIVKEPEVKEDLPIQCKTDDWGKYQLDSVYVIIRDKSVSLKELVSVYQQHLDNKTIIG